ncbi:M15 family metallopeptidase [Streptomyces sp. NPDC056817]|uniref:M15 family metallopeptidase n=1 Tax=Streptomyces sp. NPDC056817 TaxID=3345950 RepID=UPI0036ABA42B
MTLTHWGFDGRLHRGVLVVNADVVDSVKRIFARLLTDRFPIRQMNPIEEYGGDDNASMSADNSSAYNCRRAGQANAPAADSPHANGRAIDLNPTENPWMDLRCHCWQPSSRYAARTPGTGKITEGDAVWQAFHADGWIWQDIKTPDYQHFDTGYPSRPYTGTLSNS